MKRLNPLIIVFTLFSLVTATVLIIANTTRWKPATHADTRWKPENRVQEFLLAEAIPENHRYIKECDYRASRLGTQSWLVSYASRMIMPSIPSYCLIDRDGVISHMSPVSLSKVMRTEFEPNSQDSDHNKFIQDFLNLLHQEQTEIIGEARIDALKSDPDHPISEDLAAMMHPPERTPDGIYIFYAYQRIGGYVRRYEFNYSSTGIFQECIVSELANRVGPYGLYQ